MRPGPSPDAEARVRTEQERAALFAAIVLFLVPIVFALGTWELPYGFSIGRHYSVPVVAGEIGVLACAIAGGFRPWRAFGRLSRFVQIAAGVWLLTASIAASLAVAPRASLVLHAISLIHALFVLALWDRLSSEWRDWIRPMAMAMAAGAAAYTLIVFALAVAFGDHPGFDHEHFGPGVSHVRQLGFYGIVAAALGGGLLLTSHERWERPAWFATLTLGFALVMWSGGRAAFGGVIGAALLLIAISPRGEKLRAAGLFAAAFAIAVPLSMIYLPHPNHWGLGRILDFLLPADRTVQEYSSSRLEMWQQAWRGFVGAPLIGHGEGQFRIMATSAQGSFNHPHNAPLQLLFQWGLIGTLAVAAMVLGPVRRTIGRLGALPAAALPAIGVVVGLSAMSLLEGSYYHPYPLTAILLGLATLAACGSPSRAKPAAEG